MCWQTCMTWSKRRSLLKLACWLHRQAFAPLVDAGFMEIVYGGPTEGEMLCTHPLVSSIHLTGSAATYDAIVWGPNNPNKASRRASL